MNQKEYESQQIREQTAIFLANGGVVKEIPRGMSALDVITGLPEKANAERQVAREKGARATKRKWSIKKKEVV